MKNTVLKKLTFLTLFLAMSLMAIPNSVFAADNNTTLSDLDNPTMTTSLISNEINHSKASRSMEPVNRGGILNPGEAISGTFELTGWFGNDFTLIASASNTGNGSLSLNFVSARYDVPCDGVARILCKETGWSKGTYSYTLSNPTNNRVAYAITIYES